MASSIQAALDDVCVRIFEADFDYVYRSLLRMGVPRADAEDLAQEVFLVMWRRRADWDAGRPLRPWLFGVALRIAHDHRHRRGREAPVGWVDQMDDRPRGEEQVAAARAQQLVLKAIAMLPEKQRAVLILHEIEGTPMREVAEALSVPLFTAYTRLRTARKSFAKAVRRLELARPGLATADPLPLLEHERARTVPHEIKRRSLERVRALALLPHLETPPPTTLGWNWPATALAAGAVAVVVAAAAINHRLGAPHRHALATVPVATTPAAPPARNDAPEAAPALLRGLIAQWQFEDRGDVVRDHAGNGFDCQPRQRMHPATASVPGVVGQALKFDGYSYLECGSAESIARIDRAMTIAGWMNLSQPEVDLRAILGWQRGIGHGRFGLFFGLAGSKLVLASDVWGRIEARLDAPVGRWIHVAATHSADGKKRLYVDGVEVAHDGGKAVPLGTGVNPITIGGHIHPGQTYRVTQKLHAALDELALYDRALSATEIAALAHEGSAAR